jgi:hypothetical protein
MRLSEIKNHLSKLKTIGFQLPNGELVPSHFHVTEVGKVSKHFIDCGGTVRKEEVANFQLWEENDYNHRLHPEKLVKIIELSERLLTIDDLEIEVEYQSETISKYDLNFDGTNFLLVAKATNCLAKDQCVIPQKKPKIKIGELQVSASCSPNSGCC